MRWLALVALVACGRTDSKLAPAAAPPRDPGPIAGVTPVEGDYLLHDFHFTSGEVLPELRIHYATLGTPQRDAAGHVTNAVLVMHGTNGSGRQFARKQFADVLFHAGQPLDLARYYVILPDDIGHGQSAKPSDGLRARFPHYGYRDMVAAEHALVTEGLHVDHLRLVMGTSMGCMHAWMWLEQWPTAMDAAMPLACLPTAIAGRNREWRKMIIDAIQHDPAWRGGDYTAPPLAGLEAAADLLTLAGSAPVADQARLPTRAAADTAVEEAVKRGATEDANDILYAVRSSEDYDPSADLEKIVAPVMFVNSADDFINPPELGIAEQLIKRVARGRFVLLPISPTTHGHGTHTWAINWQAYLVELLGGAAP